MVADLQAVLGVPPLTGRMPVSFSCAIRVFEPRQYSCPFGDVAHATLVGLPGIQEGSGPSAAELTTRSP